MPTARCILGPIFADDLKAIKPIVSPTHTPIIAFTTDWTLAGDNTYIMGFLPFAQVTRVVKYAQEHGYFKLAVYAPRTEYSDVVISTLQKSSIPIVTMSAVTPRSELDLSASVQQFAASSKGGEGFDFDTLMLPLGGEAPAHAGQQTEQQRHQQTLSSSSAPDCGMMRRWTTIRRSMAAGSPRPTPTCARTLKSVIRRITGPRRCACHRWLMTQRLSQRFWQRSSPDAASTYSPQSAITNPLAFAGIDGIFRFRNDGYVRARTCPYWKSAPATRKWSIQPRRRLFLPARDDTGGYNF